ncbi:MAG: HDIG domain-containing protein [bacterium]|nr:HDIG domain-containing protein [bacterium]
MDRAAAWETLTEHVQDPNLRRHMLAVESAMRAYAERLGADPENWGLAGLLHDFDWEIHPSIEAHPAEGAPILRQRGCPENVVQAILAHNPVGSGVEAAAPMDFALRACDEITGLIIAATFVRPHKDIRKVKVKSVKRNWKDKLFCAAVDRQEIVESTEAFSEQCFDGKLQVWEHVGNVLAAMQGAAEQLELDGRMAP